MGNALECSAIVSLEGNACKAPSQWKERLRIDNQSKVKQHHITHKGLYITKEGSCGNCGSCGIWGNCGMCGNCGKCSNCGISGNVLSHLSRDIGRISMRTHRFHFKHVLTCKNTSLKRYFKWKRSFTKYIHFNFQIFYTSADCNGDFAVRCISSCSDSRWWASRRDVYWTRWTTVLLKSE